MPIKGLTESRRIPRIGKIHLGIKHPEKGYPMKTDYFVLPKDHPCYPKLIKLFGEKPKELRIAFPINDETIFASQWYKCYSKTKGLLCKGDGDSARRVIDVKTGALADKGSEQTETIDYPCVGRGDKANGIEPCPDYGLKCGEIMCLQFLVPEVPGLGIWQIDTGSINSIININSAIALYKPMCRGHIAFLPLTLSLESTEVTNPKNHKKEMAFCMNLRTTATMLEIQAAAKIEIAGYLDAPDLPNADEEIPDDARVFEPDPVAVTPDTRPIEQQVDDLWGPDPKKPTQKAKPAMTKQQVDNAKPLTDADFEHTEKPARDPASIKNTGNLFAACIKDFPERFADSEDVLRFINKEKADIVDPKGEYMEIAEKIRSEEK